MGEVTGSETIGVIVLNALTALVDPDHDVIADSDSRSLLDATFGDAVDESDAEEFRRVVRSLSDLSPAEYRERDDVIDRVVGAVVETLQRRDVTVVLDHRSAFELTRRQAALYSYIVSPSVDAVDGFGLDPELELAARDGVAAAAEGDYARAIEAFDRATENDPEGEDEVTLQVLAGWAHFWAGDDQTATDLAGRALDSEGDQWHLKALWIAATHAYADQFREGRRAVRLVFNWICNCPEGSSIEFEVGLGSDDALEWESVDVDSGFHVFEEIAPTVGIRFRLAGPIDSFPQLPGYYAGLATVFTEWHEISEIERTIHSGPETAAPTEQVAFRADWNGGRS